MTTFLSDMPLLGGADRMAVADPHGLTLTVVSVSVVFAALVILYFLYGLSGNIFAGKYKKKRIDDDTVAAIALALSLENAAAPDGTAAAIAMALELETASQLHEKESGIITIRHNESEWNSASFKFRKTPAL